MEPEAVRQRIDALDERILELQAERRSLLREEAARFHGLPILQRDVSDERENLTRFLVLARQPVRVDRRLPAKTSLVMTVPHRPGALLKALAALEAHGLNLTKLESRPRRGSPFEYLFYLDFEGNLEEPRVRYALAELRCTAGSLRVLGCYPAARRPGARPPATATREDDGAALSSPGAGST